MQEVPYSCLCIYWPVCLGLRNGMGSFVILKNPWPSPGVRWSGRRKSEAEQIGAREGERGLGSQKSETMNTAVIISLASDTGRPAEPLIKLSVKSLMQECFGERRIVFV